jgi:hypothetical protein
MFCRKVNIPFEVIGFSDNLEVHALDTNHKGWASGLDRSCPSFERKSNTVDLGYVRLRQYLSSKMPNTEFSKAMRNLILLKCVYDGTKSRSFRPQSEQLSNTPLTQAIVATGDFMKEFKEKNSLDFTSLVIVHDGDADETTYYAREETNRNNEKVIISVPFDYYRDVNIIRDRRIQFEYVIQRSTRYEKPVCTAVYEWFRKYTGSKIFNFFLVNNRRADMKNAIYRLYNDEQTKNLLESGESRNGNNYLAHVMAVSKIFREKKYLITEIPGTNNFYMLLGGDELETEEDKIEIEGKITTKKLTNAFLKMNKKKSVSRTFVTKFIEGIAA